jgi:hypothetical protein
VLITQLAPTTLLFRSSLLILTVCRCRNGEN